MGCGGAWKNKEERKQKGRSGLISSAAAQAHAGDGAAFYVKSIIICA